MPSGEIQLKATGPENLYLNANPSITFFKNVYKRYTNFVMNHIKLDFEGSDILDYNSGVTKKCKIPRHGDLLGRIYLRANIPNITSTTAQNFKWIRNVGIQLIERVRIFIDGQIIDEQYSDWMNIWNELSMSSSKKSNYLNMIGDIQEMYSPDSSLYNESSSVTIEENTLYIPLNVWFTHNPGLAMPLIALQYNELSVHIDFKPISSLYTVNTDNTSPLSQNNPDNFSFSNFLINSSDNISVNIEAEYFFLDDEERGWFAKRNHQYLITQVKRFTTSGLSKTNGNVIQLELFHPVIEIIWVLKRSDVNLRNEWFNFTNWDYKATAGTGSTNKKNILSSASILLNGVERLEEKDFSYFNKLQPYQHHSSSPKNGIYVYSFSLNPELFQPSGSINMSTIADIQLKLNLTTQKTTTFEYDLQIFVTNYNVLQISNGMGNIKFAN